MANLYTHRDKNIRKTWLLMAVFFGVVIALGWGFGYAYGNPIILYVAVALSIIMNVVSYWWSDKIVLKMHKAKEIKREENRELYRVLENLSISAGLPMPKFYLINDPAPNAFATGRDPKHAVVAVTSGLLDKLDRSELEGVLAHELSHIGNRDMLVSTVAVVLVGFIAILSDIFMRSLFFRSFFGGSNRDRWGGNGAMLLVGIALSILAPLAATLIHLAISRKREYLADASGALLTRYPDGLASALRKIAEYSQPMKTASNATAHLFLENPFGTDHRDPKQVSVFARWFSTHPPVVERVKALTSMKI
jgi:heat shock protein HtpX